MDMSSELASSLDLCRTFIDTFWTCTTANSLGRVFSHFVLTLPSSFGFEILACVKRNSSRPHLASTSNFQKSSGLTASMCQ